MKDASLSEDDGVRAEGVLEKKYVSGSFCLFVHDLILCQRWTSILRLQRKILDLESKISSLEEEMASSRRAGGASAVSWPNFSLSCSTLIRWSRAVFVKQKYAASSSGKACLDRS